MIFEDKSVVLEEFNPHNVSFISLTLAIKVSKDLMVGAKDKLLFFLLGQRINFFGN